MNDDDQTFRQWILAEYKRLEEEPCNIPLLDRMKQAWEMYQPQMVEKLKRVGILQETLVVFQQKMWEAEERYQQAGMYHTDAREQAEREWLLLDPPEEEGVVEIDPIEEVERLVEEQAEELRQQDNLA